MMSMRIWFLIIVLFLALIAISPSFQTGVMIKSIDKNSTAFEQGLRPGMKINSVNNKEIKSIEDYSSVLNSLFPTKEKIKLEISTDQGDFILFINQSPKISIDSIPKSKIKTGLDLSGGARAIVRPSNVSVSSSQMQDLISITNNRLNAFGISDVTVKSVSDLTGNNFMLIEVAGATTSDIKELVSQQGKFEAKIGNETVFIGGSQDIASVCRNDAKCAGIESCDALQGGGYVCRFRFVIYLSQEAAERHANITEKLGINVTDQGRYLDKKLELYLDDQLVDSLLISEDLKGRVTTNIQIQGSGTGNTQEEAFKDARSSMNKLQTILITGSLPFKLEIVKLDTISPTLGKEFTKNIIILAIVSFVIVSSIIFIKYRKIKITLSVILTMFSEAFITLGIAAFINWNLDAPSIAGIIAGMGTGVNDQIVIIDESVSNRHVSMKERIKRALFIIIGAFFTIVAAMLPLFWAGAGLLRGFALTTIIGVSVGILITRPAFAEILKKIEK